MYVCICKGITEQQIKNCADQGAASLRDLYRELSVGSQCGKCVSTARQVLNANLCQSVNCYDAASIA